MGAITTHPVENFALPSESLPIERRTWTMQEACRLLGVPYSTGCALANAGQFPCRVIRIGARFYVPKDSLDRVRSDAAA